MDCSTGIPSFFFDLWVKVRVRVRMYSGGVCTVSGACGIADAAGWLLLQLLILFLLVLEESGLYGLLLSLSLHWCCCLYLSRSDSMHFLLGEY